MSNVIIQHVYRQWTKQSRGGDGARVRNSVPSSFRIPTDAFRSSFFLHRVQFSESTNFKRNDTIEAASQFADLNLRDIELFLDDDALVVRFVRNGYNAAKPTAKPQCSNIFTLTQSQWGQLAYNGRYSCVDTGNWWYQQSTYNIGWLTTEDVNQFSNVDPSHEYSELVHLR